MNPSLPKKTGQGWRKGWPSQNPTGNFLEVTHTHIFSIPIVVFILSRILAMTHTREGLKITIYGVSFCGYSPEPGSPVAYQVCMPSLCNYLYHFQCPPHPELRGIHLHPLYEMWFRKDHDSIEE